MDLSYRGQVKIVEAALAGIVSILIIIIVSAMISSHMSFKTPARFSDDAASVLSKLSASGLMCKLIYGLNGDIDENSLIAQVESLIPGDMGFKVIVINASNGATLFSYQGSNFDVSQSASAFIIVSGCFGYYDPRIVIISVSGG